jgi:predicted nucleic acid-binding protein
VTERFVADASIGVAWSVSAQSSGKTDDLLDEVAEGARFRVPALWYLEVANALLVLTRRKRITPRECASARRALASLNPAVDEEAPTIAFGKVSDLAVEHSLSVYDAAYLELALRTGLALASRDAGLNKAAQRCGIQVLV